MNTATNSALPARQRLLSLDAWAVFFALLAALLIRAGLIKHIPW